MSLRLVEIAAVTLYWIVVTPLTVILFKQQQWIPWNGLNFWQCIATIFLFAIGLAGLSWLLFVTATVLYKRVKTWLSNRRVAVIQPNRHLSRQPSECLVETVVTVSGQPQEGGDGDLETAQPSRPAPNLPRKRGKSECEAASRLSNRKGSGSGPPPPSYDEVFKRQYSHK